MGGELGGVGGEAAGEPAGEWCVQVRRSGDEATTEHLVPDVDEFLAGLIGPARIRFTHGSSRFLDRFRDLDSPDGSTLTGLRYAEFGWRPLTSAPPPA